MQSGCEYMKCEYASRDTDNNPVCSYDKPICRYREEHSDVNGKDEDLSLALHACGIKDKEIAVLREYKQDIEAQFRMIMDEKCPKDELHCTCVPFLRIEVEKLTQKLSLYQDEHQKEMVKNVELEAEIERLKEERRER